MCIRVPGMSMYCTDLSLPACRIMLDAPPLPSSIERHLIPQIFPVLIKRRLGYLLLACVLGACMHEPKIAPSQGHITAAHEAVADPTAIPEPVTAEPYLPPPRPRHREPTFSIAVNEVPVSEILFALARDSQLNVDIHPAIEGRVTLNAVDQTLPAILDRLAKQVDLTYKVDGDVLTIQPDQPVLHSYKIDYVNMSRDTAGFIGAAAEIASTGVAAATGAAGVSAVRSNTAGTNNSSRTSVTSESKHHFWDTLVSNVRSLLAETESASDKLYNPATAGVVVVPGGNAAAAVPAVPSRTPPPINVIVNPEAGILTIRATSKQHRKVQEFLDKVMASVRRQVLIEATIVEVQLNDIYQAGIDWSRLGNGFSFSEALGSTTIFTGASGLTTGLAGSRSPFIVGYASSGSLGDIDLKLRLLQQFGEAKVLSSPKLMVLNNQTAVLKVVDNLVYFTVQSQVSQGVGVGSTNLTSVTTTPNTVPVGIVMSVTPQISAGGMVNINVRPTISSLLRYVPDPNPVIPAGFNQGIPEIQVREMESLLQISSGNVAVLGGLMQDIAQHNSDHVPGLYKIPLIGWLFTAQSDIYKKTELVIFLKPTVISTPTLQSAELARFREFLPSNQLRDTTVMREAAP